MAHITGAKAALGSLSELIAGRLTMARPIVTDMQCEALFASALQRSDAVTPEAVSEAISHTIGQLGAVGCADRMAAEFGDHPEAARDRMQWARQLVGELLGDSESPVAGNAPSAA